MNRGTNYARLMKNWRNNYKKKTHEAITLIEPKSTKWWPAVHTQERLYFLLRKSIIYFIFSGKTTRLTTTWFNQLHTMIWSPSRNGHLKNSNISLTKISHLMLILDFIIRDLPICRLFKAMVSWQRGIAGVKISNQQICMDLHSEMVFIHVTTR